MLTRSRGAEPATCVRFRGRIARRGQQSLQTGCSVMPEHPVVRDRPRVRPPPAAPLVVAAHANVDAVLQGSAIVTSGLALLLLAGVPSAAGTAGQVVRGLVLLCFWLIAPGAVVVARLRLPGLCKPAL